VKDRLQALKNPYAHLHLPDISLQMVEESIMFVGSAALPRGVPVLGRGGSHGARLGQGGVRGASGNGSAPGVGARHGHALGADHVRRAATRSTLRLAGTAAKDVYAQAGVSDRVPNSTAPRFYVPFSWYEPDVAGKPRVLRGG